MGLYNPVGSNAYDARSFGICIMDLADARGNNITLYTLPSLEAIKQLQQQRVDVRLSELLSKWDDLCRSRDIKHIIPVRYDRATNQVRMPKSFTQQSQSREINIQVISEYDNLINPKASVKLGVKADEPEAAKIPPKASPEVATPRKSEEVKSSTPIATVDEQADEEVVKSSPEVFHDVTTPRKPEVVKSSMQIATVVEQSEEEEAEILAEFEELASVIHAVSKDTLKQKDGKDKNEMIITPQAPETGRRPTQAQHKHKNVDVATSDVYSRGGTKTTRKREREDGTSPAAEKRKRSEKLTEELDEDARIRQTAVKKDQLKREIQDKDR